MEKKNKPTMLTDAVYINKLHHMAIQNLPQDIREELDFGENLMTSTKKIDFKKAYVIVDKQIELCKNFARKDEDQADKYNKVGRRLIVVRSLLEEVLNSVFLVTVSNKKAVASIESKQGMMDKVFVEHVYRLALYELPEKMQADLRVRKDDLLISSRRNNEKGWEQAYNILDRQIKLCDKNMVKDEENAVTYPLVSRRLKALQTMIVDTLKGEFGVEIVADKQGKIDCVKKDGLIV